MSEDREKAKFVVVEPHRTCCDYYARVLDTAGVLRLLLIGTASQDQQRPIIWNIGAIAASGRPGALSGK